MQVNQLFFIVYNAEPSESNVAPSSMVGRNFLTLRHFTQPEIETFLWTAKDLKTRIKEENQVSVCITCCNFWNQVRVITF